MCIMPRSCPSNYMKQKAGSDAGFLLAPPVGQLSNQMIADMLVISELPEMIY